MPDKPKMKPYKPAKVTSPILDRMKERGYGPGGPQTPGAKAKRNTGNDFDHSKTTKKKR